MSRLTKEELDEQFEQFLKESVSDESVDLGGTGSTHRSSVLDSLGKARPAPKPQKKSTVSVPWWQDEDDSEGGPGREERSVKRRFTKVRKAQTEDSQQDAILPGKGPPQAVRAEPCFKPTPKPRSKALDRLSQLDKIHTANQEAPWPEEDTRSEIQRSPTNEGSHNVPGVRSPDESPCEGPARVSSDSDSQSSGDGLLGSGRTFRKSLRRSQPIQEEVEGQPEEEDVEAVVSFSRDSLEQEDHLLASGRGGGLAGGGLAGGGLAGGGLAGGGLDTLEEEEEKARFFARLEGGPSAVDYSRLNRELESTSSTTTLRNAEQVVGLEDREQDEEVESERNSPASPHYSEDFEDEGSAREDEEQKPLRPAMLARVSLHDSLDSTCEVPPTGERGGAGEEEQEEERRREARDIADSLETAVPARSYGQSGGSDMEALHEAYRQISQPAEGSGGPRLPAPQLPAPPGGRDRTSSPGSPPAPTTTSPPGPGAPSGSLRAASTSGSDLPTAEELLRRIMPDNDDSRGFTLQPVSGAELQPDSPGMSGERCSPQTSPRRWASAPSPDPPSPAPRPASIKEEVSRLMQEGGLWPPDLLSPPGTNQRSQVPGWSAASGPPSAPQRRGRGGGRKPPTVAPRSPGPGRHGAGAGGRAKAGAGAGGRAKAGAGAGGRAGAKTGAKAGVRPGAGAGAKPPSTLDQTRTISSSPAPSEQAQAPQALRVSGELVASVQSFAAFLQHQIDTGGHQNTADVSRETKECPEGGRREPGWREESRAEECPLVDRVRMQSDQDREERTARDQLTQQELSSLRQENFLLQSKLRSVEESSRRGRWCVDPSDPLSDKIQLMEKEMNNQETLIQGYHQENEKLYQQMKSLQAQRKVDEEAMFLENQRLLSELALTREQLNKSNMQRTVGNAGVVDQSQRITELLGQIQAAKRVETRLVEETARLKQEKQGLEVDLQVMRRERDQALTSTGQAGWEQQRLQEERHREEVCALTTRLQWYADNQDLLDRDTARLKDATAEISKLTLQVEKLKAEVGRSRAAQRQSRAQEKAADTRRTHDLERQVKELEAILRRRNPNSLPALLYAAAAQGAEPPTQTAALLERRVHRLEAELEGKDDDAKRSLRTMEQHFQRIKLQYEQQISELERQVAAGTGPSESWATQVQLLQEELDRLQQSQQAREQALQDQLHLLQDQLSQRALAGPSPGTGPGAGPGTGTGPGPGTRPSLEPEPGPGRGQRSPSRHQLQTEAAQGARIERLTQELAAKTRSVQELTRTVDRLQRERRTMLGGPAASPRPQARAPGDPRRPAPPPKAPAGPGERGEAAFPPTLDEKAYQPTAFAGSHISEVLQEKEALRERLERLEGERRQEGLALREEAALAREELRRLQESSAEQLSCLQVVHQGELERLLARHALEHSSSKLAQLTNHIATQEVVVQHLREQVKDLQSTKDALAVSKLREDALQEQLSRLLEDLRQATEAHSPQLRHFLSLDRKIHSMEVRHAQRERELQQVVGLRLPVQQQGEAGEVQAWKRLAQERSRELEVFRLELDSILDILRALQQQGVVIPSPAHLGGAGGAWTT